jgi:putative transposase
VVEVWSTLKVELVQRRTCPTGAMARPAVFEWIESFYNLQHSSLGYRTACGVQKLRSAAVQGERPSLG